MSRYKVGDRRPRWGSNGGPACRAVKDSLGCAWPKGHTGDHIATVSGGEIVAIWRQEHEPFYVEGDADPTGNVTHICEFEFTNSRGEDCYCTWPEGHEGAHVAGDGERVCGVNPMPASLLPVPTQEEIDATIASVRDAF